MLASARSRIAPDERRASSKTAAANLISLLDKLQITTVALYSPIRAELDPTAAWPVLCLNNVTVVFPVVASEGTLDFRITDSLSLLRPGAFGVLEPPAHCPSVELTNPQHAIVVPALALDPHGRRLGYGHGYYDRALTAHPAAQRIGFVFSSQLIEIVPSAPEDEPVDWVVTERLHFPTYSRRRG
jgi:5-formyltetrahydrofolate cyclo-ligase